MHPSRSRPVRLTAPAVALALAVSAVGAPVAQAQDEDVLAAIDGFERAMEALDLEAVRGHLCEAEVDRLGGVGLAELLDEVPPSLDVELLLDGVTVDIELASVEVVSRSDDAAVVALEGSFHSEVDPESLRPMVEALFSLLGAEADPDLVDDALAQLSEALPEDTSTELSGEVELVRDEAGDWRLCSDLPLVAEPGVAVT